MAKNTSLKSLGLGSNKIGPVGCKAICKAAVANAGLEKLEMCTPGSKRVDGNEFGPESFECLAKLLKDSKLRFVDLSIVG